ncbi:class I SAM-dependent methyltransferase [Haliscomenobacter sp.]|uniref:class I SAM-dependent methyltransferase n=1 Tax=Haliscomenobacter sp. TaxID=2717303 RepID=UPI003593A63F
MEFLKLMVQNCVGFIKSLVPNTIMRTINSDKIGDEESYYTYLFTKDVGWSKSSPNKNELLRWGQIEKKVKNILSGDEFKDRAPYIIDFGCGRGWLAFLLSSYGKVTGIEPVGKVVVHAKKIYPQIDVRMGSLAILNKLETKPDIIVSSEVIEHIPHEEKLSYFGSFNAALQNKGFLIVTTPRAEAWEEWSKYALPDQPVEEWISGAELEKLATESGFTTIESEVFSESPNEEAPAIDVYQLWVFQKNEQ